VIARPGKVWPVIDSIYELDDVLQAYERQMSKRARGKIIVSINHDA
jgi:NADPH:quinone reductase-like Zn-dependent oxidoreductase